MEGKLLRQRARKSAISTPGARQLLSQRGDETLRLCQRLRLCLYFLFNLGDINGTGGFYDLLVFSISIMVAIGCVILRFAANDSCGTARLHALLVFGSACATTVYFTTALSTLQNCVVFA